MNSILEGIQPFWHVRKKNYSKWQSAIKYNIYPSKNTCVKKAQVRLIKTVCQKNVSVLRFQSINVQNSTNMPSLGIPVSLYFHCMLIYSINFTPSFHFGPRRRESFGFSISSFINVPSFTSMRKIYSLMNRAYSPKAGK